MKTVLPDSNVIIDLFNGIRAAAPRLADADRILVSPTVLGEVFAGFSDSAKDRSRKAVMEDFLALPYVEVPYVTETTSEYYAGLHRYLKGAGRKIPDNDLWMASQALENAALIVTRDSHFLDIPNLRVWMP